MTGLGIFQLDGRRRPSNYFPKRLFYHQRNEGPGHWLVAYRHVLEEGILKKKNISSFEVHSRKHEKRQQKGASNALDARLLITLHCVDQPSDLYFVNVSGQHLQTVKLEGLEQFHNIAYINASDNRLTLEPFGRFPALRELELSLNTLHNVEIHAEDFQKLEVLDLSFNNMTGESILNLGLLPCLKVLHLTGNQLQMLPLNMAGPAENSTEHGVLLYQTLEVLMLDDNKLTSPEVFMSLANLQSLHHLNLQGNYISGVPFLEQMAKIEEAQTSLIPQSTGHSMSLNKDERIQHTKITTSEQKTLTEDKAYLEMRSGYSKHFDQRKEDGSSLDLTLPFPELQRLNLANNQIAEEEALLPVALFPKLNELVIHSNPLTTRRSGDPPMLTRFLQDKLGVTITRKKATDLNKRHITLPVSPKRKIKTTIAVMANQHAADLSCSEKCTGEDSLLPSESGLTHAFGSSQTSIEEEEDNVMSSTSGEISFEMKQNAEPFFVTEVYGINQSEYQEEPDDAKETNLEMKKCSDACPEKLIGYEILLNDTSEPVLPQISGVQHAIKVLDHTLKNLLVYRDHKANLDHPQKPYTEKEKKIKDLPPLASKHSKGEKAEELLTRIKETKAVIKVPLDNVLEGGNDVSQREYEEAVTLLKDLKRKYRTACLQRAEQAAQIETEDVI